MDGECTESLSPERDASERVDAIPDQAETARMSTDDRFHVLQSERRREALRYLRDADGPVELRDLAERIAAREHETTVEALTSQQRQRVYISLYQTHLPKLDECGVADYRKDRGIVVRRPAADHLDAHLDLVDRDDSATAWPRRYAGAVTLGVGLLGASTAGLVSVSGTAIAALLLAVVGFVATAHSWAAGSIPFVEP